MYLAVSSATNSVTFNRGGPSKQTEKRNVNTHQSATGLGSFRYLAVTLYGDGVHVRFYAFLDNRSELTLIDQQLAEDLKLSGAVQRRNMRTLLLDVRTVEELQLPYLSLDMNSSRSGMTICVV